MKLHLNDEKTPVDLRLLNDILWGLKALCVIHPFMLKSSHEKVFYGIYFFGKNQLLVGSKSEVTLVSMLILHICRAHVEYLYVLSQHCAFHSVLV